MPQLYFVFNLNDHKSWRFVDDLNSNIFFCMYKSKIVIARVSFLYTILIILWYCVHVSGDVHCFASLMDSRKLNLKTDEPLSPGDKYKDVSKHVHVYHSWSQLIGKHLMNIVLSFTTEVCGAEILMPCGIRPVTFGNPSYRSPWKIFMNTLLNQWNSSTTVTNACQSNARKRHEK